MTKSQAEKLVALSLPSDSAGSEDVAGILIDMAVVVAGRRRGLNFNRERVGFSLTSGKATYELGKDILTDYSKIKNIQEMWLTGTVGWEVEIVGLDRFNYLTSGGSTSGKPYVGTVYVKDDIPVLEVYPSPSDNYAVKALIKKNLTKFEDVPEEHRDVVINIAITTGKSLADPKLSLELLKEGLRDIEIDSLTAWRGTTIRVERPLDAGTSVRSADSGNLRPT